MQHESFGETSEETKSFIKLKGSLFEVRGMKRFLPVFLYGKKKEAEKRLD